MEMIVIIVLTLSLGSAIGYIIINHKVDKAIVTSKAREVSLKDQEDERIKSEHFQALMNYDANQAYNRGGR